jgi:hypothetical protein
MYPHLNIHHSSTRSHPSEGENRTENRSKNLRIESKEKGPLGIVIQRCRISEMAISGPFNSSTLGCHTKISEDGYIQVILELGKGLALLVK